MMALNPRLRRISVALFATIVACAPEPIRLAETEGQPPNHGEWAAAHDTTLVQLDGAVFAERAGARQPVAAEMVGSPSISDDGAHIVLAHRGEGASASVLDTLTLESTGLTQHRLVDIGAPDRVGISPDGAWVAYVNGISGLASVWAIPFAGGTPTQLTNVDLERVPGQAPVGFVPPPHDSPLRIVDHTVVWRSPDGEHIVALP
jgi:hypothetical protein